MLLGAMAFMTNVRTVCRSASWLLPNSVRRILRDRAAVALMSCAATKSASLINAGCAGRFEMTHPTGRFHRCTLLYLSKGHVARIGQLGVGPLPVPHPLTRVLQVLQDRGDRAGVDSVSGDVRGGDGWGCLRH